MSEVSRSVLFILIGSMDYKFNVKPLFSRSYLLAGDLSFDLLYLAGLPIR